jgi:propanediol dehydratase large subunit
MAEYQPRNRNQDTAIAHAGDWVDNKHILVNAGGIFYNLNDVEHCDLPLSSWRVEGERWVCIEDNYG